MYCGQRITKNQEQKTMKGKPVKYITKEDKPIQQKEKPNNVNKNKTTYALIIHNKSQNSENNDINQTLQLILNKITNLEGAFSKTNERDKKLESGTKKTAPKTNKNGQYHKNHVLECKWIAQPTTRAASNPRHKQN